MPKKKLTLAREAEMADKHRGSLKSKILMSPNGREICEKIRRETWYQLMSRSPDGTLRRLSASILMAGALDKLRPERHV